MSVYKNGVVMSPLFYENNATSNLSNPNLSYTYTPTKDKDNSCMFGQAIDFTDYVGSSKDISFHVELDVEYSGFDASSTAGTFYMYFQGSVYNIESKAFDWKSSSGMCTSLNNQKSLKSLVISNTSGTYHYSTDFVVSSTFLKSYSKHYLGIRTNYSNGTGTITIRNIKICESKYYTGESKAVVANDYIAVTELVEY